MEGGRGKERKTERQKRKERREGRRGKQEGREKTRTARTQQQPRVCKAQCMSEAPALAAFALIG